MSKWTPPDQQRFVGFMREASPYLRAHRDQTFVVYLGGDAIEAAGFPLIVQDLALLCGIGVKLVLVHGARPQVEARLRKAGLPTRLVRDLRVTDSASLREVRHAVTHVRYALEAQFAHMTGPPQAGAEDLRLVTGNFVTAQPVGVIDGVDLEFTGETRKLDVISLRGQMNHADIVLMSPLAHSPTGELFSLNALDLATETAMALGASKLVLYSPQAEVTDAQGSVRRQLTAHELRAPDSINGPPANILASALRASEGGVERVHLVSSAQDGALLLELFTRDGVGTLVSSVPFDQLRPATIKDVGGILGLIEPLEAEGVLVKRSREKLEREIDRFLVMVRDGATVACGAVYPYPGDGMAELACIAVDPDYRRSGYGAVLLDALERGAAAAGMAEVFVLTTQTTHWFQERGYGRSGIEDLPMARQALYNYQRNSVVLKKAVREG